MSYVAIDLERFKQATWGVKFSWVWISVVFGPLGLVAYLFSYQKPQSSLDPKIQTADWRRALGATVYSVAGSALGMILVQVIFNNVPSMDEASPVINILVIYLMPLLTGWLIFRAPAVTSALQTRYWIAIRRTLLAEVISVNLVLSVAIPLILIPTNWYPDFFGPASPPTFLVFSLVATAGALFTYPYNAWMIRRGFHVWPIRTSIDRSLTLEDGLLAIPTIRNAWVVLVLSIVIILTSFVLTIQILT
jgi:hypothetical protein